MLDVRAASAMVVALATAAGCTDSSHSAPTPRGGEPVGIVVNASAAAPEVRAVATFPLGVEPGPHIPPLATVLAAARDHCFSPDVTIGAMARIALDVADHKITVREHDRSGTCFADVLNGVAINEPTKLHVDLQYSFEK